MRGSAKNEEDEDGDGDAGRKAAMAKHIAGPEDCGEDAADGTVDRTRRGAEGSQAYELW